MKDDEAEAQKPPRPEETEEQKQKKEKALKEQWDGFHIRSAHRQQQREKYLEKARQQQAEKELSKCTFAPKPRRAKSSSSVSSGNQSLFERTKALEAKKQARLEKMRQEQYAKEMAQCSF